MKFEVGNEVDINGVYQDLIGFDDCRVIKTNKKKVYITSARLNEISNKTTHFVFEYKQKHHMAALKIKQPLLVLSNEEIIKRGKEAQKFEFLYRKKTARNYQVRWIRDDILRDTDKDKVHVVFAPTGAGKTTTKKMVVESIDRLVDKEKSFTIVTVPDDSQIITVEFYNELIDKLPKNVGVVVSPRFSNRITVRPNVHVYKNAEDFKTWSKTIKHVVSIGAHNFFRNHLKDALSNNPTILKDRRLIVLIDEIHKALHTDGRQFYPENLENHIDQYSSIGINLIKDLMNLGFTITGFSGTPSKQQRGESTSSGVFKFVDMTKEELKEVQLNNTYLDKVSYNDSKTRKEHIVETVQGLKEDVYNRDGIGIMYLARGGTRHWDEYDHDRFVNDIYPHLPANSVLFWYGGAQKFKSWDSSADHSDIKHGRWRTNYDTNTDIHDILAKNPQIKLVVVKELLKDGFNWPNLNNVIFARPINKEEEFLTNEQQIGRGVRFGNGVGLRLTFLSKSSNVGHTNSRNLVEKVLKRGTILPKKEYEELEAKFQPQKDSLLTKAEAVEIEGRIRAKLPLLKDGLEKIIAAKSSVLFGQKLEIKEVSDEITQATERFFGSFDNMTKTAGMNDEDGFIYFPTNDKFISYDVKSKVLSSDESDMFNEYSNDTLTLKDKLKGDGKINNHIVHIVVTSMIENNKLKSLDFNIVEIPKEYSDEMNSNSIKFIKILNDLSIHSFTV